MSVNKNKKLEEKRKEIENKITIIENRISLENKKKRFKEDTFKRRVASTFLLSDIFKVIDKVKFSQYELFTIAGLIILNNLDKYTSDILMACYNAEIKKCLNNKKYELELYGLGKNRYIQDRKISKDIEEVLYLINGILIKCYELIENSNIEDLKIKGQIEFARIKEGQRKRKTDAILKKIKGL